MFLIFRCVRIFPLNFHIQYQNRDFADEKQQNDSRTCYSVPWIKALTNEGKQRSTWNQGNDRSLFTSVRPSPMHGKISNICMICWFLLNKEPFKWYFLHEPGLQLPNLITLDELLHCWHSQYVIAYTFLIWNLFDLKMFIRLITINLVYVQSIKLSYPNPYVGVTCNFIKKTSWIISSFQNGLNV